MASRSRQRPGAVKLNGTSETDWKESDNQLLDFLFQPIQLPLFDFTSAKFSQGISDTIDRVIERALRDALPPQTMGVQFIYARRPSGSAADNPIALRFEHPLIMKGCGSDEMRALADGLGYVTHLLNSEQSPSFHARVRRHRLTDAPAVCVFTDAPITNGDLRIKAINVIQTTLRVPDQRHPIIFPSDEIQEIGNGLFRADLVPGLKEGRYSQERGGLSDALAAPPQILCVAGDDRLRRQRLRELAKRLAKDSAYLKRVSRLLQVGDIILCTPHAYTPPPHEPTDARFFGELPADCGLTVILRRDGIVREIDWVRVQTVAQVLATFAGSALATADRAYARAADRLGEHVRHEFRNSGAQIYAKVRELSEGGKCLTEQDANDLNGRLKFTGELIESALMFDDRIEDEGEEILNRLIVPLRQFRDLEITLDLNIRIGSRVSVMWTGVLGEALRNAYKHAAAINALKTVKITGHDNGGSLFVEVENCVSQPGVDRPNSRGRKLMEEFASELGGSYELSKRDRQIVARIRMPLRAAH
jgi:hypothetical protein